jgi:hypothetical protein
MARKNSSKKIDVNKISGSDACNFLGGNYDHDDGTCDIPVKKDRTRSILDRGGLLFFFALQIVIGGISVILSTYYTPTDLPANWWTSYIMLAIVLILSTLMYWYKLGSWREALLRSLVSLVIISITSVVIGWIYFWNFTLYWGIIGFAGLPIAATIAGVVISALISIVLVSPSNRKGDDPSNDFTFGEIK